MSKNTRKNRALKAKKSGNFKTVPATDEVVTADLKKPEEAPVETETPKLYYRTRMGVIDTALYERLLKPSFVSFAQRRDEETLKQLVESLVNDVALRKEDKGEAGIMTGLHILGISIDILISTIQALMNSKMQMSFRKSCLSILRLIQ